MLPIDIAELFPNFIDCYIEIDPEKDYDVILIYFQDNEIVFLNTDELYYTKNIDILINISNIDMISNGCRNKSHVLLVSDEYTDYKEKIYGLIFGDDNYMEFTKEKPKRWSRTEDCVVDINNNTFVYGDDLNYYLIPSHISYHEKQEDNVYVVKADKSHKDYKEMYDYSDEEWENKEFIYLDIKSDMRDYSRYKRDIADLFNI